MSASARPRGASVATMKKEMRRLLEARRDATYVEFIAEVIGSRDRVIGVRVPAIRAAVREFLAAHRNITLDERVALMDGCARRRIREELLFATFTLARFEKRLEPGLMERVDAWVEAIDNWEMCDQLAMGVAAPLVGRDIGQVERLVRWSRAKNPWRRRFAVATAAALNQKGRRLPRETLRVCVAVLHDPEPQVRKAVGWAIREASRADEAAAFAFLCTHRGTMHPTVLREASEKLTKEHRAALLREAGGGKPKRTKKPKH